MKPRFTVPEVWRKIVKKSERQGDGVFDVLICNHAVPAALDNPYRKGRSCPECRVQVQRFADDYARSNPAPAPAAARGRRKVAA
ncbi:MAG: hypothetical protein ACJ79L_14430 [Anaeromyxobacteraceae bacterium]